MLTEILSMPLARRVPDEIGWTRAVRSKANDAAAHDYLTRRYPRIFAAASPEVVLSSWEPLNRAMMYYLRANDRGEWSFISTDRVFAHATPVGRNSWKDAPPNIFRLLQRCAHAWHQWAGESRCPLEPGDNGYPRALLLHDLGTERVALHLSAQAHAVHSPQEAAR